MAFLAAGEDRGDLRLGRSLVAGIKNTTADFLVDGIVAVGVALNEPHFAGFHLSTLRVRVVLFLLLLMGVSFLRPGAAGCSWLLCGRCSFTSALEALTQPPLGELCAVPFALVGVQRAGRASLELLVDRGVVDAQAGRDVDRPISEQMPRLDLLPVLEGQVAVLSRRSHLRLIWSIKKKKCTVDSVGVSVHLILADTGFLSILNRKWN